MDDAPVRPGDLLGSKYRVERILGSGSMGVIVAAEHVELGQRVALKFLLPSTIQNGEAASRFLREARAAVKIESEHVARVLDVGRLEQGSPYLVMEFLEGADLSTHPRGEELPVEVALDYVLQACAGMAVAHSVGVIHRDLKPANLFLTTQADGSPLIKVLDFGISKMSLMESVPELTQGSAFMGSPIYMSPEQAQSPRAVDARTDIWSLGVILYELLGGAPPFAGETLREVINALLTTEPKSLRLLRPSLPAGLDEAVLRALEKSLDRRYANVGEFSAALVEFAAPESRVLHERVLRVLQRARAQGRGTHPSIAPPPLDVPKSEPARVIGTSPSFFPPASPALPPAPRLPRMVSQLELIPKDTGTLPSFAHPSAKGAERRLPRFGPVSGWVQRARWGAESRKPLVLGVSLGLAGALLCFLFLSRSQRYAETKAEATTPAEVAQDPVKSGSESTYPDANLGKARQANLKAMIRVTPEGPALATPHGEDAEESGPRSDPPHSTGAEPNARKRASQAARKSARAPRPSASVVRTDVPPTKKACEPPYYFKAGIKTYRPECL